MNSLNILSSHVTPTLGPSLSRSNSIPAISLTSVASDPDGPPDTPDLPDLPDLPDALDATGTDSTLDITDPFSSSASRARAAPTATIPAVSTKTMEETTPLLSQKDLHESVSSTGNVRLSKWRSLPKQIALTVWHSIRWFLQTIAAPGTYLMAFFYNDQGVFSPLTAARRLFQPDDAMSQKEGDLHHKKAAAYLDTDRDFSRDEKTRRLSNDSDMSVSTTSWAGGRRFFGKPPASSSLPLGDDRRSSYAVSSESESDFDRRVVGAGERAAQGGPRKKGGAALGTAGRRGTTGSRSGEDDSAAGNAAGGRRSVRIKLNDDTLKQRKHRRGQSSVASSRRGANGGASGNGGDSFAAGSRSGGGGAPAKDISAQLKSPTSPVGALTRYPRTPAPPRPLLPRRQPSYLNLETMDQTHQKTLILDLDETLIHSMSKGGRMSTGHMVEVRLNTTFVGMGGQPSAGPQHPILYYVHKRPYCDEFLRRVCKWFNLVIFTASVQEYADPVIDWLESERKFFSARYYRQHCTFRHGAFIKDLSAVEPDLSKVMILDNSPLSYMFHQDNAIPIQGWISDHTDNDLLHLVPLLEGLQYVSDVRALLALRGGEDGRHMA